MLINRININDTIIKKLYLHCINYTEISTVHHTSKKTDFSTNKHFSIFYRHFYLLSHKTVLTSGTIIRLLYFLSSFCDKNYFSDFLPSKMSEFIMTEDLYQVQETDLIWKIISAFGNCQSNLRSTWPKRCQNLIFWNNCSCFI